MDPPSGGDGAAGGASGGMSGPGSAPLPTSAPLSSTPISSISVTASGGSVSLSAPFPAFRTTYEALSRALAGVSITGNLPRLRDGAPVSGAGVPFGSILAGVTTGVVTDGGPPMSGGLLAGGACGTTTTSVAGTSVTALPVTPPPPPTGSTLSAPISLPISLPIAMPPSASPAVMAVSPEALQAAVLQALARAAAGGSL